VRGHVVGVNDMSWHDPGSAFIKNVKTGKVRTIHPWSKSERLCVHGPVPRAGAKRCAYCGCLQHAHICHNCEMPRGEILNL